MPSFHKQVTVHYTAEQMYDLINDINAYSTFIPLCVSSEVHEEQDQQLRATIKIDKGKIGFQFTTVNTMEKGRSIVMNLEHGPFNRLLKITHMPSAANPFLNLFLGPEARSALK